MKNNISLMVDMKLKRPACVIIQAAMGCGENNSFLQEISCAEKWILTLTKDMQKVSVTRESWLDASAKLGWRNAI